MKKLVIAAAVGLLLAANPSFASAEEGLTDAQTAQLEAQRAAMVAENVKNNTPVEQTKSAVDSANEWVKVGQGVGSGLASAARELGVAVNDFAATPVGQITVALIVWKVAGGDLVQLVVGLAYFAVAAPAYLVFYRKAWAPKHVHTEYYETGKIKSVTREEQDLDDRSVAGDRILGALAGFGVVGIGCAIIFA